MQSGILKKNKWVFLQTKEEFDQFIARDDLYGGIKSGSSQSAFCQWVNRYYEYLLTDIGPLNGPFFS